MKRNDKVGIEQEQKDRLWRYEYLYRNEVYIYHREGLFARIYLLIRVVLHILRVILKAKDSRKDKINVILHSYLKGFSFKPRIEFFDR